METKDISLVVPAYNEGSYIGETITSMNSFLSKEFPSFEIIVVDDGSSDNTGDILIELSKKISGLRIITNAKNMGKGHSVQRGVLSAKGKYIVFSDSDLSVPIEELGKFLNCLKEGSDIAIGSRALKGSNIIKEQSFLRKNMGRTFNLLIRLFLFGGIVDTQCGFKAFKSKAAKTLFNLQRVKGFCFDAEILYIAKKLKYKIQEIPIKWVNRPDSRVSMIKNSTLMFLDIFRIKANDLGGRYGA